jgi:TetR/AcrR family transcriptional regulator, tetracycline repressor protein
MALHKRQIIAQAIKLLDQEGIEGVTLRPLADRLGVQAPALYWHVKNKSDLLDEMAEAILLEQFAEISPREVEEPWQDWLAGMARRLRAAMLAHREGARVVAGAHLQPAVTLARLTEASLQSLCSAGIELRHAWTITNTVIQFTFGHVIEEQAAPSLEEVRRYSLSVHTDVYPLLAQATAAIATTPQPGESGFNEGLRLILIGGAHLR